MMHFNKKLYMLAALLLLTGLAFAASKLPPNYPADIIPIPKDAIIDNDNFDRYDMLFSCAKYATAGDIIEFYHDNLKKTIIGLNESPSKDGQKYWFWGEFDNGKAVFYVVILNADNKDPENATAMQIRVLRMKKGEIESYWKLKKDMHKQYIMGALE